MKHLFLFLITMVFMSVTSLADTSLLKRLQEIKEISDIKKMDISPYKEYYEFWFEQPVDHSDPSKGNFKQRVLLGHRNFNVPMVAVLEGYGIHTANESELSELFNTNQITIEHRFFNQSVPSSGIPWKYLTIKQAAADQHNIIQAIRKIYPGTKWISTGISKGGQTTIYHRYFYPEDVEISVPYVAPMNLEAIDPRLEKYLDNLGGTPEHRKLFEGGGKDIKWQIIDFQKRCFENLNTLVPKMQEFARDHNYTFLTVGGVERATKLVILEFPFAFWQWGADINDMPTEDSRDMNEIFNYLVTVSSPDFFDDKSIVKLQPFYYAALTETGMYAYDIKRFKKYFKEEPDNTIDFHFALPAGIDKVSFNTKQLQAINKWLQTNAQNMLFIYGGLDPWSGTAVDLKKNEKCLKYVKADMDHKCRIQSFENLTKSAILKKLNSWIKGIEEEESEELIY